MAILINVLFAFSLYGNEPTPVSFQKYQDEIDLVKAQQWSPPVYEKQDNALGWSPTAFAIPVGMESRISFWLDIYTKFSSQNGLLHDSRYVNIVYEVVDFTAISKDNNLSERQKQRARRKLVKGAKEKIVKRLKRIQKVHDLGLEKESELTEEDKRLLQMFHNVGEKSKFIAASKKGRLRFQLGQKDRFKQGIYFSGRYIQEMEEIFRQHNLPIELTRLPFVESSFNLKARSRVGASGIWQFMRSTGRMYMKIDGAVDERNEPLKATESAAKMLSQNYKMLGNWPLAVTAYNHGPSGMRRLVKRSGTDDIVELIDIRKGRFGFASANFYASFLAAVIAEQRGEKFFGKLMRDEALQYEKLVLTKHINSKILLNWFAGDKNLAKKYNPHLTRYFWKGYRLIRPRRFILLPKSRFAEAKEYLLKMKNPARLGKGKGTYVIARGDTLGQIARNFGVSLRELRDINGIDNPRRIRSGQKIIIPPSRKK